MSLSPENRRILSGLFAGLVLAGAGCSASAASRRPKVVSPPQVPPAVAAARQAFAAGRDAALAGDFQCAEESFARALEAVRPARGEPPADAATIDFSVELYEAIHQNGLHDVIGRGLARSGRFIPMIERIFVEEGLPKDLAQVAMVESSFIPRARSPKAACGIWQFIPSTGREYGLTSNAVVDE